MPQRCEDAFGSIESAQEFLALLTEAIQETKQDVKADIEEHGIENSRRIDALQIALYDLQVLEHHISRSKRLLNNLRMVRRILLQDRGISEDQLPAIPASLPSVVMEAPPANPGLLRMRPKKYARREETVRIAVG